jgi:hypothetical protein
MTTLPGPGGLSVEQQVKWNARTLEQRAKQFVEHTGNFIWIEDSPTATAIWCKYGALACRYCHSGSSVQEVLTIGSNMGNIRKQGEKDKCVMGREDFVASPTHTTSLHQSQDSHLPALLQLSHRHVNAVARIRAQAESRAA